MIQPRVLPNDASASGMLHGVEPSPMWVESGHSYCSTDRCNPTCPASHFSVLDGQFSISDISFVKARHFQTALIGATGRVTMPCSYPLHRFEEFGRLSQSELDAVTRLGGKPYEVARGRPVLMEGDVVSGLFLLCKGWVLASSQLSDGNQQVLKVHLPGDLLGATNMSSDRALTTLTPVTPAVVSSVRLTDLSALVEQHPRMAMRIFLSAQRERVALMDQLTSMGQTKATSQMAALLLDLAERLKPLGLVRDDTFRIMLTQVQIGDLLGLTSIHVNRTLRCLEEEGLIARTGRLLSILARAELVRLAARPSRPPRQQLDWLPAAR